MFPISGKVALITGGSEGIGAAIAKELLRAELKGVAILGRSAGKGTRRVEELTNEFGKGRVIFIRADVLIKEEIEEAFKKTVEIFHNIDIVVNNALSRTKDWDRYIAANLTGTITGTMLAYETYLPKYASDNKGVIINISSPSGLYGSPFSPLYAAAKSGSIALTISLGSDYHYNRTGIKVIAVCPGYTDTAAIDLGQDNFQGPAYYEAFVEAIKALPPPQPASVVGKAVVTVIKEARSGSVWMIHDSQPPYEVKTQVVKV
ncbi:15-hydroxyprostaglandin dehydrogenase [NAD(+)]-like [Photinus pyralis]|uniref:15-hydroxyprostaglandin dehydrogenase [NAD(+)]-like n=1 Tax=Photinus pyralis TaxID=7054 RepID=UPI0012677BE1|nr:15-hydroxyprostaglandin dehydrogenase [NAD(+)]-like [Photinus pyralis]